MENLGLITEEEINVLSDSTGMRTENTDIISASATAAGAAGGGAGAAGGAAGAAAGN